MNSKTYLYDGTFFGLLSLIYRLISLNEAPEDIVSEAMEKKQESLFGVKLFVETSRDNYELIKKMIIEKIGKPSFDVIAWAYLSELRGIEMAVYKYVLFSLEKGGDTDRFLSDSRVMEIHGAYRKICMESHRFKGFLRFEEIKPGVLYAKLEPDYNIIMMLASHFKRRLSGYNWIIHDKKRGTAVFYDRHKCVLKEAVSFVLPDTAGNEAAFRKMWAGYFGAMGIKERKNYRLQRQLVPKKYRKNMVEFNS